MISGVWEIGIASGAKRISLDTLRHVVGIGLSIVMVGGVPSDVEDAYGSRLAVGLEGTFLGTRKSTAKGIKSDPASPIPSKGGENGRSKHKK